MLYSQPIRRDAPSDGCAAAGYAVRLQDQSVYAMRADLFVSSTAFINHHHPSSCIIIHHWRIV